MQNDRDRGRYNDRDKGSYHKRNSDSYHHDDRRHRDDERKASRHSSSSTSHYSANKERNSYSHNSRDERSRFDSSSTRHPRRNSRDRESKHHRSYRRDRSNERTSARHSRSGSRTHSRSRSPERNASDQARLSAQRMEKKLVTLEQKTAETGHDASQNSSSTETRKLPHARNFEALLSLPLADTVPKQPHIIAVSSLGNAGSSAADPTLIQLPSYYNPSVMNPNKYAEQVQKRKLIWGAKKTEDTAAKWAGAQFSEDSDGKVASKFMRLMGVKGAAAANDSEKAATATATTATAAPVAPDVKSRQAMFSSMEKQYEVARQVTHTMRGVGLGFGSQSRPI